GAGVLGLPEGVMEGVFEDFVIDLPGARQLRLVDAVGQRVERLAGAGLPAGAGLRRHVVEPVVEAVVAGARCLQGAGLELLVEVVLEEGGQLGVLGVGGAGRGGENGHGEKKERRDGTAHGVASRFSGGSQSRAGRRPAASLYARLAAAPTVGYDAPRNLSQPRTNPMPAKQPRILVLAASVGAGHV